MSLPEWFRDIVGWWQDPKRADGKPFTHGQRLHDWSGDQTRNQLEAIIEILRLDATTSRGIAVLINPDTDNVADKTIDFPSFSLLHLWIGDGALNCSAFFRKQEMNYWWAVNAAEIADIQRHVLQALRSSHRELTAGAIRTHASQAVFSGHLPKVNVPRIDRLFWQDPDSLRMLAVAVADLAMPGRENDVSTLLSLMEDWAPQAEAPPTDGAAAPTRGLAALANMLAMLAERYPTSPADEIGELLREMDEANGPYLERRDTGDPLRAYKQWRTPQLRRITRIPRVACAAGRISLRGRASNRPLLAAANHYHRSDMSEFRERSRSGDPPPGAVRRDALRPKVIPVTSGRRLVAASLSSASVRDEESPA